MTFQEKIKLQLKEAKADLKREPSARTQGYIDALEWCMKNKTEDIPWTCNFCGDKLMFHQIIYPIPRDMLNQLSSKSGLTGTEEMRLQVCNNKKCGRVYIFFESTNHTQKTEVTT